MPLHHYAVLLRQPDYNNKYAFTPILYMSTSSFARIKIRHHGMIEIFHLGDVELTPKDLCIVSYDRGKDFGVCLELLDDTDITVPESQSVLYLCREQEEQVIAQNAKEAEELIPICKEEIAAHDLSMKIITSEYTFDKRKVIFYFCAEQRVDFRALVRSLAARIKVRIELRQIGIRDETKCIGGIGCCGRKTCCSTWIEEFDSVNIRMAKVQQIQLNPSKLSGLCGRLKCCLCYEYTHYHDLEKHLPKKGQRVRTPDGTADVKDVALLTQKLFVTFDDGRSAWYDAARVTTVSRSKSRAQTKAKKRKAQRRTSSGPQNREPDSPR